MSIKRTICVFFIMLLSTLAAWAGEENEGRKNERDSLFLIPHEQYFQRNSFQSHILVPRQTNRSLNTLAVPFPNINISNNTAPQNEPSVIISHADANRVVAAWRDFRTGVSPAIRRVGYSYSTDGGATWSVSNLIPQFGGPFQPYHRNSDPALAVDLDGFFYISTVSGNDNDASGKLTVYKSVDGGASFTPIAIAPADTAFANFDDKEYITSDLNPSSPFANALYISWTRFGNPGGISLTSSFNSGLTWSTRTPISDPSNSGQGSDPCVAPNGDVCVVWSGGPGIMFDKSTDGGFSFGTDVVVDSLTGSVTNSFPSIKVDRSEGPRKGYLYVTYADSRFGDEDVFFQYSSDRGATWSGRTRVNDDAVGNGKNQFWPWIAVDDRGVVTIVYYDTRNTPDLNTSETYIAYSWDGGKTFANKLISTAQSPRNTPNGDVRYGDYIGIDSWGKHTVSVWTDERAGGFDMDIYTAVMDTLPRPNFVVLQFPVRSGWNMVSSPVGGDVKLVADLFPSATPPAYAFEGAYTPHDTLQLGTGYWLRFNAGENIHVEGDSIKELDVTVQDGWNLIGSISSAIPANTITSNPPALTVSPFFTFNGTYVHSDSIFPGGAYWVKVNGSGTLTLSSSAGALQTNKIRIVATNELPPSAPGDQLSVLAGVPGSYALEQNYPNPFNPTTTLSFSIRHESFVTLKVYDILGNEIKTLVHGFLQAGRYSRVLDAADLPSGIYAYRLIAGEYNETRKMLLMK